MKSGKILIIGACGQLGTELTNALRDRFGKNVVASDRYPISNQFELYQQLDVLNYKAVEDLVKREKITQVYLLAAMLSASSEKNAESAWELNMQGLLNVLKIAHLLKLDKVFWPSSIAVFGSGVPKRDCPQNTIIEPKTIYGISKRSGELWCNYYFEKHGVDVRSLRYPGLISYKTAPGGGTTDYAIDIFHQALEKKIFTCFLKQDTCLPMMYMPDAVRATIELMDAPKEKISIRTSYNLASFSFTPNELRQAIQKRIPQFQVEYMPDFRQHIADGWPGSINDVVAQNDWGWKSEYSMDQMVEDMLEKLLEKNNLTNKKLFANH